MRALRPLALLLAALGLGACGSAEASDRAHSLVADGATLLDVRTPGEFSAQHLEGAVNIPVDALPGRLAELPADRAVVVYCRSGGRSASAARTLRAQGYEVHDLGAMTNW